LLLAACTSNVTVVGTDGKDVLLSTGSGHAFSLPAEHAPPRCVQGTSFCLDMGSVTSATMTEHARMRAAKALLNEILTAT